MVDKTFCPRMTFRAHFARKSLRDLYLRPIERGFSNADITASLQYPGLNQGFFFSAVVFFCKQLLAPAIYG